jgi:hypothetical protein
MTHSLRRLTALTVAVIAAAFAEARTEAQPQVIITVDVESVEKVALPDQVDPMCTDGSRCGLMGIVGTLAERGLAGTFFLNPYEYKQWGEPTMRAIAVALQHAGQEVGLHTHPQWAYDANRNEMFEYSLDEQTRIVEDGVRMLSNWTGMPVVSHRTGDYSADFNTLQALARNGISLDSSVFLEHPHSRLSQLGLPSNIPTSVEGITEIPVTVYRREEYPRFVGRLAPPFSTVRKIDPNWFRSEDEALAAIDAEIQSNTPFIVFFLHSFSFIGSVGTDHTPVPDAASRQRFSSMLDHIEARGLTVVTMRDLAASPSIVSPERKDFVPSVPVVSPVYLYLGHWARSRPDIAIAGAAGLVLVGAAIVGIFVRRHYAVRRTNRPTPYNA